MKCVNCGAEISENAKFCTKCGTKQEPKVEKITPAFCTKCGNKLKAGAKFCTGCGTPIKEIIRENADSANTTNIAETVSSQQSVKPVQPTVPPQPTVSPQPTVPVQPAVASQQVTPVESAVPSQSVTPSPVSEETVPLFDVEEPIIVKQKENKSGKTGIIIALVVIVVLIIVALIGGGFIIYSQFIKEPTVVEERDRDEKDDDRDKSKDEPEEKKDESEESTEEESVKTSAEIDLSTVDYNLTESNVLTLDGNVLESVSEGKVIKLGAPVKFYGVNEEGNNTLLENVGSVIIKDDKLPDGMVDSVNGNTEVSMTGTVSIEDGKVYILVDTMTDDKGKDMVAKFENGSDEDYILPNSSVERLTEDDIVGLSLKELCYARNEIFARHGRMFKSQELQDYFDSQEWYEGTILPNDFNINTLSKIERDNVDLLKDREYSLDSKGYKLD